MRLQQPTRVLVVENDPLARQVYRSLLDGMAPGIRQIGEAATSDDALELVEALEPDVVILAILLGTSSGFHLTRALIYRGYTGGILVVSVLPEEPYAIQALEAGALGYLQKEDALGHLREAIESVARRRTYLRPGAASYLLSNLFQVRVGRSQTHSTLTPRERETLALLARGLSNKEIATHLNCSTRTAKAHVSQVLRKLGVEDRTQAALLAVRFGLTEAVISSKTAERPFVVL